ncbi:MAG: hypothetical protein IID61_13740 [SAR324 cluster bacterium]|nr:hypothetical protein [SAR324 cluster bacterium]
MLRIVRGEQGWHTYTLRKVRPLGPHARFDLEALTQSWTRLYRAAGKAWRRVQPRWVHHRQEPPGFE